MYKVHKVLHISVTKVLCLRQSRRHPPEWNTTSPTTQLSSKMWCQRDNKQVSLQIVWQWVTHHRSWKKKAKSASNAIKRCRSSRAPSADRSQDLHTYRSGTQNIRLPQLGEQWKRKRSQAADGKSLQAINSKYTHHVCKVKKNPKDLLTAENQVRATCPHVKKDSPLYLSRCEAEIHCIHHDGRAKSTQDLHRSAYMYPAIGSSEPFGCGLHSVTRQESSQQRVIPTAKGFTLFSFFTANSKTLPSDSTQLFTSQAQNCTAQQTGSRTFGYSKQLNSLVLSLKQRQLHKKDMKYFAKWHICAYLLQKGTAKLSAQKWGFGGGCRKRLDSFEMCHLRIRAKTPCICRQHILNELTHLAPTKQQEIDRPC